jgi:hypothetical protein
MVELLHGVASRVLEVVEVESELKHGNLDTGQEIVLGCGFKKKVLEPQCLLISICCGFLG